MSSVSLEPGCSCQRPRGAGPSSPRRGGDGDRPPSASPAGSSLLRGDGVHLRQAWHHVDGEVICDGTAQSTGMVVGLIDEEGAGHGKLAVLGNPLCCREHPLRTQLQLPGFAHAHCRVGPCGHAPGIDRGCILGQRLRCGNHGSPWLGRDRWVRRATSTNPALIRTDRAPRYWTPNRG